MNLRDLIPPARIRVTFPFTGAFRKAEAEYAAAWLALFARERSPESWEPISCDAFVEWLRACGNRPEFVPYLMNPFIDLARGFHLLKAGRWIGETPETFEVTDEFVLRCFLAGHRLIVPLRHTAAAMSRAPSFMQAALVTFTAPDGAEAES